MPSLDDLALEAEQEIGRNKAFFPILPRLGNRWAAHRPWEGRAIGRSVHLTTLSAALVQELTLGGASCVVAAANPATTDPGVVHLLRQRGVEVYTGGDLEDRHLQLLDHEPELFVDVGFELMAALLDRRQELVGRVHGAVVTSRSGVDRLRGRVAPPFPVVNIQDGALHHAVENRHGIGEAVWQAVAALTGMHLAGRRAAVVGYGPVGRGLASWARGAGMAVEVVERDPIRRLFAHYDGFPTPDLREALHRAQVAVTATGHAGALTVHDVADAADGLVLLNAGTGGDEIDIKGLTSVAERVDHVADSVVRMRLETGTTVTILGGGHPLNIVLNSGSPEPILLHFAVAGLALEWLVGDSGGMAGTGEVAVPRAVEEAAARAALDALAAGGSA